MFLSLLLSLSLTLLSTLAQDLGSLNPCTVTCINQLVKQSNCVPATPQCLCPHRQDIQICIGKTCSISDLESSLHALDAFCQTSTLYSPSQHRLRAPTATPATSPPTTKPSSRPPAAPPSPSRSIATPPSIIIGSTLIPIGTPEPTHEQPPIIVTAITINPTPAINPTPVPSSASNTATSSTPPLPNTIPLPALLSDPSQPQTTIVFSAQLPSSPPSTGNIGGTTPSPALPSTPSQPQTIIIFRTESPSSPPSTGNTSGTTPSSWNRVSTTHLIAPLLFAVFCFSLHDLI